MQCKIKNIAIVVPVYNEAGNVLKLHSRLSSVTKLLSQYRWSFVYVNDGSMDNSLEALKSIASDFSSVKVIDLSRNFGKEIALTAGVHETEISDAIICIDADLQHPPELIPRLVEQWEQGAEVVVTIRKDVAGHSFFRKICSKLYYYLVNKISYVEMVPQTTDFRLYDKKVVQAFVHATERERMFRGIMDWLGFKRHYVEFTADERYSGSSGYTYYKLWRLAVHGFTSYSLWPLRVAGYIGGFITCISGFALLWMAINQLVSDEVLYTAIAYVLLTNTFLIGIVLMAIGLVALYVGIIHTEVINRPLYVIRETIN